MYRCHESAWFPVEFDTSLFNDAFFRCSSLWAHLHFQDMILLSRKIGSGRTNSNIFSEDVYSVHYICDAGRGILKLFPDLLFVVRNIYLCLALPETTEALVVKLLVYF